MITEYVYEVSLFIEIIDPDTGQVIDYQTEEEYFQTYEAARKRAEYLSRLIGEEICHWGNDVGILCYVDFDDEPQRVMVYE
ncbi:MAG: hypothetical protein NC093_02555 [Alistipes sp.]|nr:hypothetical protein [Alistipes sp.]